MIMRNLAVLMLALFVVGSIGCQTNPKFKDYDKKIDEKISPVQKIPTYFKDRLLDLTDIGQVNLAVGRGALANLHGTKGLQFGVGYRDGVCFGYAPRSFGMWHESRTEGGFALAPLMHLYYKNCSREALWGTSTLFERDTCFRGADHLSNDISHYSDIGFSLHALLGLDVNISPFQIFDFVTGFFGMPFQI